MKVKTNYEHCRYITAGRVYEVELDSDGDEMITDNEGDVIHIDIDGCAHLRGHEWEVVR